MLVSCNFPAGPADGARGIPPSNLCAVNLPNAGATALRLGQADAAGEHPVYSGCDHDFFEWIPL